MKKIIIYTASLFLLLGCLDDEALDTPSIAFYPDRVGVAKEMDGISYIIPIQTTGVVSGAGQARISVTNGEFLQTIPAMENGVITINFENGQTDASISVLVGNDDFKEGYEAVFSFSNVSGGIKSYTNTTYTLLVSDDDLQIIFSDDFESNSLNKWTSYSTASTNNWGVSSFADNIYAIASNYQADEPSDDWLISPSINFDKFEDEVLSFMNETAFNDDNILEVVVLEGYTEGDPTGAIISTLDPVLDPHRGGGFGSFTFSGDLDLGGITGFAQIAFHFKANDINDGTQWQVDDVELRGINLSGVSALTSLNENFESVSTSGNLSIESWTNLAEAGTVKWKGKAAVDGNKYAKFSAVNSGEGSNIGWLVTPLINFDGLSTKTMSFNSQVRFKDGAQLQLYYSTDFDGTNAASANWATLNYNEATVATDETSDWVNSGEVSLSAAFGEGYIGFKYIGSGTSLGLDGEFLIDDIVVGAGGGTGGGGGNDIFFDDFEGCTEDFSTPSNFIEAFVSGSKTDRGWGCRSEGVDGSQGVRASAFGGVDGTDNAWLITASKINLSGVSTAYLSMDISSDFDGAGTLKAHWSENYSGSGDPSSASWTELSDFTSQLPVKGSEDFTFVVSDLQMAVGKQVYIAIQYNDGTSANSASFEIDNYLVSEDEPTDGGGGSGGGGGGGSGAAVDISDARSMDGQDVVITGIITTPDYGFNNDNYFVQDNTGGINVINFTDTGVNIGDMVEITGTIGAFNQVVQIEVASFTVISTENTLPAAVTISSSDLSAENALQGSRVTLSGVTLVDASQWPVDPIMDGSGVSVVATVNGVSFEIRIDRGESFYDASTAPTGTFTITGILSRFNEAVQIMPFVDGDIN